MREESPDDGQVSVEQNITIGYFSQDVGEMKGRPVVAEVMAGAGAVSAGRGRAEDAGGGAGRSGARRRDGQDPGALRRGAGALRRARRLRARGAGARDPGRPRVLAGGHGRRRRQPVGRLEDARRPGAHPAHAPRRHAARRAVEPPRPRIAHLAGGLPQGLRGRAADDLARSRVPEPHRRADHRDRRRRADQLLGQPRLLREAAGAERGAGAGGLRSAAVDAGQGDALHRALQGAGGQGVAGAVAGEEARQDREGRAAQAAQGAGLRVPALRALGRGRRQDRRRRTSATARASSTTGSTCRSAARSAGRSWA